MQTSKKALLAETISSLRNDPGSWNWGAPDRRSHISHHSGVKVWVSDLSAYVWQPFEVKFGFIGHLRLRSAFRHWRRVQGRKQARLMEVQNASLVLGLLRGDAVPLRRAA